MDIKCSKPLHSRDNSNQNSIFTQIPPSRAGFA